jgi:hypothetical protein
MPHENDHCGKTVDRLWREAMIALSIIATITIAALIFEVLF